MYSKSKNEWNEVTTNQKQEKKTGKIRRTRVLSGNER
jgi:hypothetical protein